MCRNHKLPRDLLGAHPLHRGHATAPRPGSRHGLTLVELLLAVTVMTLITGVLGGLAAAVNSSVAYSRGHGTATQHARVVLERVARTVSQATATELYPGAVAVFDESGGWRFPDTLVVWRPAGSPVNPSGPPLVEELVIFCPDPDDPFRLLEVTVPGDMRTVPLDETLNTAYWRSEIKTLARSAASRRVVLTDLVRVGSVDGTDATTAGNLRAAVRFECEPQPSAAEWSDYVAGTAPWNSLAWPQGICGSNTGLRQVWVRVELELVPEQWRGRPDVAGQVAIPFLGSTSLSCEMHR